MANAFDPATLPATFDALKCGQIVRIAFTSCMGASAPEGIEFKVGRRSHSKKYNVTTIALNPVDGRKVHPMARVKLFKRPTCVTLAQGNMGAVLHSIEVVA